MCRSVRNLEAKALFGGRQGRGARREAVAQALAQTRATGREHGFHFGPGGTDRKPRAGSATGVSFPGLQNALSGRGSHFHHTHPKQRNGKPADTLSPGDLHSIFKAPGRSTLWMHDSATGVHEAARLSKRAAQMKPADRMSVFSRAFHATKPKAPGPQDYAHGQALRRELHRQGLIHTARSKPRT